MKLHVVHRTTYRYAAPVSQNLNETRLKPVSLHGQLCDAFEMMITPPARVSSYLDFYLNHVQTFEILDPHNELMIQSSADVTTSFQPLALDAATVPIARLAESSQIDKCYDFTQPSSLVAVSPEVWRMALDASAGQTDIWQTAVAIMRFIHSQFQYVPAATTVSTHMNEVVRQRKGVCQDFAHVMLGMCRALKIPARYVSGYIYNGATGRASAGTTDATGNLVGAQASHAWCEVFVPEFGWRALDPTNSQAADDRYIKVAVGRDYSDAAPIKGHYRGTPTREMTVEVQLNALAENPALPSFSSAILP
jgi:transglutaminase-like putative cysteine protease